jgi:dCMP deaminase
MRVPWDIYFLNLAQAVSTRATCNRLQVGCVLVRNNDTIATGYNGSVKGEPHCTDVGCLLNSQKACIRTIHSESNAIIRAARYGVSTEGAIAYITHSPCAECLKLLINAGVKRIVYATEYRIPPDSALADRCGVFIHHMPLPVDPT